MDKTLHALYDDARMAQQVIQQLIAAGIDQHAIQLISASTASGAERDHTGGYADSGEHMHSAERDHTGGYADSGEHMHSAARDRVGSFAGVEPARKRALRVIDTLKAAGLSAEDAQSCATRMDAGAVVLCVRIGPDRLAQVAEILHVA